MNHNIKYIYNLRTSHPQTNAIVCNSWNRKTYEPSRWTALQKGISAREKFWGLTVVCQFKKHEKHQVSLQLHILTHFSSKSGNSLCNNSEQLK